MDPQPEPVSYICGGFFPNLILLCRNWVSIFSFSANINVCLGFWGWIVIISVRILQIVAWRIRWSPATLYSAASAVTVSFTRSALVAVSFVFINSLFCIHSVSFVAAAKLSFCFLHSCILIKKIEVISNYSCLWKWSLFQLCVFYNVLVKLFEIGVVLKQSITVFSFSHQSL